MSPCIQLVCKGSPNDGAVRVEDAQVEHCGEKASKDVEQDGAEELILSSKGAKINEVTGVGLSVKAMKRYQVKTAAVEGEVWEDGAGSCGGKNLDVLKNGGGKENAEDSVVDGCQDAAVDKAVVADKGDLGYAFGCLVEVQLGPGSVGAKTPSLVWVAAQLELCPSVGGMPPSWGEEALVAAQLGLIVCLLRLSWGWLGCSPVGVMFVCLHCW